MNRPGQSVTINLKCICTLNREKTLTFKIYLKPIRLISDKRGQRVMRSPGQYVFLNLIFFSGCGEI